MSGLPDGVALRQAASEPWRSVTLCGAASDGLDDAEKAELLRLLHAHSVAEKLEGLTRLVGQSESPPRVRRSVHALTLAAQ